MRMDAFRSVNVQDWRFDPRDILVAWRLGRPHPPGLEGTEDSTPTDRQLESKEKSGPAPAPRQAPQ